MDVMPHSSLRLHPWIKPSRPQSPEPLRHSRQHDTLHGGTGSRSIVTGWEDSNAGLGTCSADFQGLFYNSTCCKHSSLSCCKPGPHLVPRKQPAVLRLPVASATAAHNVPYGLGLHLPHAEAPWLLEAALVTAPCPCTLPIARALFSSHHMSLFQLKPQLGLLPSGKLQRAKPIPGSCAWQPRPPTSPTAGPGLQSPKRLFLCLVTPCHGMRALGFGAWKLGLQLQGFHTKAYQFPSPARIFKLPEEEISWPVPTIAPCRFCQVFSHSQAFGISFADSFFSVFFPHFSFCGSPLMSSAACLSQEARRTSSSRNSLARNSRGRKTTTRRRPTKRKANLAACSHGWPPGPTRPGLGRRCP
ncbi:arrestin-C isoform X4 [Harpia harpyja]|uniref:arrestin-C isoform X4 n=1 Tax=Harpia harpyja TaxID=202280 RepID=UPI0022B0B423|nr:arrestin-C isoform X4 [Harpia harpyja]